MTKSLQAIVAVLLSLLGLSSAAAYADTNVSMSTVVKNSDGTFNEDRDPPIITVNND